MERQRKTSQVKEQENSPGKKQKNPKEKEISNLPDKEFKETVIGSSLTLGVDRGT